MIVDLILNRKDYEKDCPGVTYAMYFEWANSKEGKAAIAEARRNGMIIPPPYNPRDFYMNVMAYGGYHAEQITRAMDYGTEEDVRKALCNYIMGEYNPEICNYINSVQWLVEA